MLEILLSRGLLDYVAMDVKHRWLRYADAVGLRTPKIADIRCSVDLLLRGHVDYEFRTTVIRDFHDLQDIVALSEQIRGARRYVVQEFIPKKTLDASFGRKLPFEKSSLEALIPEVKKNVQRFEIRQ
jgi:pyruvate formate lyase activating enzyme